MSSNFDRQRDALPARVGTGFRLQEIRQRELEREAARRWPLLAAIDDYLWNAQMRRNAFERTAAYGEALQPVTAPVAAASGGHPWSNRR